MPRLTLPDGQHLAYDDTGGDGPVVVFSHGLLFSRSQFAPQIAALRGRYRCIAYDHRGQGESEVPDAPVITIEQNTADARALIERLGLGPVHFVGLSMGGFVGMRLAARHPALIRSLCLLNTTAEAEPPKNLPRYRLLAAAAQVFGAGLLAGPTMKIVTGPSFRADPARKADRDALHAELAGQPRHLAKAIAGVFGRAAVAHELAAIRAPTLVIAGEEDVATPPKASQRIAARISGAALVSIPRAGHSSSRENPEAVTAFLSAFLDAQP